MSIKDNFPSLGPSLSLNFARSKTLDPRITFSRTSVGTYTDGNGLIVTGSADEPRFDHEYENGVVKSLGLLVEEQRTNLVTNNEDLSLWKQNSNPTLNSNDTVSPDGNTTADKLTQTSQVFTGVSTDMSGITTNTVYSCSVFIKPDGDTRTRFGFYDTSNWQGSLDTDWSSGEPSTNGSLGGASDIVYEKYSNGWYRASFKASTQSNAFAGTVSFYCHPDRTGTGKSAWFWGAQLEEGAFPTSYVPTTSSTVTRSADSVSMTGTNFSDWYNTTEGTIFVDCTPVYSSPTNQYKRLLSIHNNSGSQVDVIQLIQYEQSNLVQFAVWDGSNPQALFSKNPSTSGTRFKVAFAVKENNINASYDGNIGTDDTTCTLPAMTEMDIGSYNNGANIQKLHINNISYYPKRLTNTQLQNLTK